MNTHSNSDRPAYDQYFTPRWAVEALLEYEKIPKGAIIGEPCAGAGHIMAVLQAHGYTTIGSEIDPTIPVVDPALDIRYGLDFKTPEAVSYYEGIADWIITNPPYSVREPPEKPGGPKGAIIVTAAQIIEQALLAAPNVAMLLRLGWIEACYDRLDLLPKIDKIIVIPRVKFKNSKGKGANYPSVWVVWKRGRFEETPSMIWADREWCEDLQKQYKRDAYEAKRKKVIT